MEDLTFNMGMLKKAKYNQETISMDKIVSWPDMAHVKGLATGPGKKHLRVNLPWVGVLKLFIEVHIYN